jgi:hypothetical protein
MRLGLNYFATCETCGGLGHLSSNCPARDIYHKQAIRQLAHGSRDPEILREVYGEQLEKQEPFQC